MIFHNDTSKKKPYLIKLSLLCAVIFIAITVIVFLLIDSIKQDYIFLITILTLLFAYYIFVIVRTRKNYDKLSIEFFEDKLVLSMPKRNIELAFNEIKEIISYPTILDKHYLIIHCGNWKAVGISSNIENFEELKKTLFAIKPLSAKKRIGRRIFDYSFIISVFSAIIASNIKNFPALVVIATIGILSSALNIVRYVKSKIKVSHKVTGILAHSVLAGSLIFLIIIHGIFDSKSSYRKSLDGTTVLMKKEEVSKYDRHGNLKFHKTGYDKEYYKYDKKNGLVYRTYKSDSYKILYTYKNDNLIEKKYSDGCIYTYEYDENGNETCYSDNQGYSEWSKYDSNNNLIETIDSDGFHQFYKYDENNNLIYQNNDDNEYYIYTYDEKNRRIKASGEGYLMTSEYNNKDLLVSQISVIDDSRISTKIIEYDDRGNEIHLIYSTHNKDGEELYYEDTKKLYDENNNIIKLTINDEFEIEYSYDYDKHGRVLRSYSFSK